MELSNKTARQMYEELKADPNLPRYEFGRKPLIVNVDLQCAYTSVGAYPTAYETDPKQADYVNQLNGMARSHGFPVVWTYVAFVESGEDCGIFGTRDNYVESLQNIKIGSPKAELDPRLEVAASDIVINKKMPSAFHETHLQSLATFHGCDTVIVTGGSTSGCVRATVVDALSRSYRVIVPEECVADLHESPHFANLYDMLKKYAAVVSIKDVLAFYA
jgi:maleamate amidohydrolase